MKFISLFIIMMISLLFASCSKVPSGHVGVKVYLLGGNKGVDQEVLGVGKYWIGMNEELHLFPTFTQTYNWTSSKDEGKDADESISFQTKDGASLKANVGISYTLEKAKIGEIFQTYRKGVDEITDVILRNKVRDVLNKLASNYTAEEAFSTAKKELMDKALTDVKKEFDKKGIIVSDLFLIGEVVLPENIKAALNSKIEATQLAMKAENEVRTAKAHADAEVAEAKGAAEAMRIKSAALANNPGLTQYEAVLHWDGKLPVTMLGSTMPFINIK